MFSSLFGAACSRASVDFATFPAPAVDLPASAGDGTKTAVLAGGCFWCTEGVYEQIPGVVDVVSGYAGGTKADAEYHKVGRGETGHAESIQIKYDPSKITYGQILRVFFGVAHDPTTLDRQGPDAGHQYRSTVFYANDDEKRVADAYIKQLNDAAVFAAPIATTVEPLTEFYPAEDYHQDYARLHPNEGYVMQNSAPKIAKAKKAAEELKKSAMPTTQPTR